MTTDYTLRCMLYLSGKEGLSSPLEAREAVGISKILVQKVLHVLYDTGVVSSAHGGTGGHRLTEKPEEIVLLDIILLFEKMMEIDRYLKPEGYYDRYEMCPVHAYYKEVRKTLESYFERDTLQDMVNHGKRERKEMIHNAKER